MAERKFGTDSYRCDKIDAEQAMRLLIRITKVLGPASGIMGAIGAKSDDGAALQAIADFATKLDEEAAVELLKDLIGLCRCNGEPAILGATPQFIEDALPIAMWVMETQFSTFLQGVLGGRAVKTPSILKRSA